MDAEKRKTFLMVAAVGLPLLLCGTCGGLYAIGHEKAEKDRAALAASSSTHAAPTASVYKPTWLARQLALISDDPNGQRPVSVDRTGRKTNTWVYETFPGWQLIQFVRSKSNVDAWRFELDGGPCSAIQQLGPSVLELGADGSGWYKVVGGPLDGLRMKVFRQGGSCNLLPGTREYWREQNETIPD